MAPPASRGRFLIVAGRFCARAPYIDELVEQIKPERRAEAERSGRQKPAENLQYFINGIAADAVAPGFFKLCRALRRRLIGGRLPGGRLSGCRLSGGRLCSRGYGA